MIKSRLHLQLSPSLPPTTAPSAIISADSATIENPWVGLRAPAVVGRSGGASRRLVGNHRRILVSTLGLYWVEKTVHAVNKTVKSKQILCPNFMPYLSFAQNQLIRPQPGSLQIGDKIQTSNEYPQNPLLCLLMYYICILALQKSMAEKRE